MRSMHNLTENVSQIRNTSPSRSGYASPRKKINNVPMPSTISDFMGSLDYESGQTTLPPNLVTMIPERDWRILAALARKRKVEVERETIAERVKKLWEKERILREIVEAQNSEKFRKYIHQRREEDRQCAEDRRIKRIQEEQHKSEFVRDSIKYKERKYAEFMCETEERKVLQIADRAFDSIARATLAADKRSHRSYEEQKRARRDYDNSKNKVDHAERKRAAMLKEASQRIAINNALSDWGTTLTRQDLTAMEAHRRAYQEAHIAEMDARIDRIATNKAIKKRKARLIADITAELRTAIKYGRPLSADI